ncbi:hypothetical protein ACQQ2N_16825 [Dokdonella sp. MW10]|uniref:hypothetical protein n=1 Tax=Dokdonella sp. MW10 TaxID=2992926 RepID=UPI003F7D5FA7
MLVPGESTGEERSFSVVRDWQCLADADGEAIVQLWLREGALGDEPRARERLGQVVAHARDADGAVVGVCTVYADTLAQTGQPMYHYRSFVAEAWRSSLVVRALIIEAVRCLEDYAVANDYPCVGIVVELENPRFRHALADVPVWRGPGVRLVYVGRSARGLDVRLQYFRGASLRRRAVPADPVISR